MYSERAILDLVGSIYAALEDQRLWPHFLSQFASACQAQVGTLYSQDRKTHYGTTEFVHGMDPSYIGSYRAYYAPRNIYLTRGQRLLQTGNVTCSEELCPTSEVLRSEFYNDWLSPQKLGPGLNGVVFHTGSIIGSVPTENSSAAKKGL
jgi:hypothetical protein